MMYPDSFFFPGSHQHSSLSHKFDAHGLYGYICRSRTETMSLKQSLEHLLLEHLLPEHLLPEHLHRRITHAILWAVWSQSGIIVQAGGCDFL
jgi:hypothetical protein